MKKFLLAVSMLAFAGLAMAQHYHGDGFRHPGYYRGPGIGWVGPAIIGGVIGYELTRPQTVYVEPQPSVIVQQPVVVQSLPAQPSQNCTPWTETQHPDGTITRTRTCAQ